MSNIYFPFYRKIHVHFSWFLSYFYNIFICIFFFNPEIFNMNLDNINWGKVNGLVPAIIQDFKSSQVLMLGYMNKEALENTINTNFVHFYSRTKKRLWKKVDGEIS